MKTTQIRTAAVAAIAMLFSFAAHAKLDISTYESARTERLANAQSEVQVMDNATPEELQQMMGTPEIGEMLFESQYSTSARATGAEVEIDVSIASQRLTATYPGGEFHAIISSARRGYHTVTGCFRHPHLEAMHYSSKYENSPMPHSMFFYGGYAIHGTDEENELGRPASHGCVRVSKANAAYLYSIVEQYGAANTRICVH